MLNAILKRFI